MGKWSWLTRFSDSFRCAQDSITNRQTTSKYLDARLESTCAACRLLPDDYTDSAKETIMEYDRSVLIEPLDLFVVFPERFAHPRVEYCVELQCRTNCEDRQYTDRSAFGMFASVEMGRDLGRAGCDGASHVKGCCWQSRRCRYGHASWSWDAAWLLERGGSDQPRFRRKGTMEGCWYYFVSKRVDPERCG